MIGPIGLHGGGEYQSGDEPFLDALIVAARQAAFARVNGDGATGGDEAMNGEPPTVRIVILPTAAARGRPDRAAAMGIAALTSRADRFGLPFRVDVARVLDAESARNAANVELLASADLIHLPGGDPDLIPAILAGSPALAAIRAARERGAVVAGASAGGMALADWTWTPKGGIRGLGFVAGLALVPHYDDVRRTAWQRTLDQLAPGEIGYLGLDERTGAISNAESGSGRTWRVAGPGAAYWFPRGARLPTVTRDGETFDIPV
jgi:cyanophycinase-like exopeptidase